MYTLIVNGRDSSQHSGRREARKQYNRWSTVERSFYHHNVFLAHCNNQKLLSCVDSSVMNTHQIMEVHTA